MLMMVPPGGVPRSNRQPADTHDYRRQAGNAHDAGSCGGKALNRLGAGADDS